MTFSELTSDEIDQVSGGKEVDWGAPPPSMPDPVNNGGDSQPF